jgi:hypothetical protein
MAEEIQKSFRLSPEEDAKLPTLIEVAYKRGYIQKPTFEQYMYFSMNCALTLMRQAHLQRTGRPFTCFACGTNRS